MRKSIPKSYEYIEKLLSPESTLMQEARANSEQLGLQTISISATEAALIRFHLEGIQAKKMVEIGTLTGLSALHFLSSLPEDGFLWTLEKSPQHAELAKKVLAREIQKKRCEILLGDARETLKVLSEKAPFDAVFIDGNKAAYLDYFHWAIQNIRVGGLILIDNVFLAGAVWGDLTQQKFSDKQISIVQRVNEMAFENSTLRSVLLPTEEGLLICQKQS